MEIMIGKHTQQFQAAEFNVLAARFTTASIDLGTGDGRFVIEQARQRPNELCIGIDACRENLRGVSRAAPINALFVIANALDLPAELAGIAGCVTINFPWGSLLTGLLDGSPELLRGLAALVQPGMDLEVRLNASALAEAGWDLETGGQQAARVLASAGYLLQTPQWMDAAVLRKFPSSWSRRMAAGRQPRAVLLRAAAGLPVQLTLANDHRVTADAD